VNYPCQPCFLQACSTRALVRVPWRAFARRAFARHTSVTVILAVTACAALLDPAIAAARFGAFFDVLWHVWVYGASIVLEAAPFVMAGSIAAALLQRFGRGVATPLLVALAPGCDCAMNGFASALRRCPPIVAGMSLVWGAVCNPVALFATGLILGSRVLAARMIGGAVAALLIGVLWRWTTALRPHDGRHACRPDDVNASRSPRAKSSATAATIASHVEDGLRLLLPAAFAASAVLVLLPALVRHHASPAVAAIAAALLSPCSTADPILAKVIAGSPAAEAAFVIAAQCADVRQIVLLARHFGARRAALAAFAAVVGCLAAVFVAR